MSTEEGEECLTVGLFSARSLTSRTLVGLCYGESQEAEKRNKEEIDSGRTQQPYFGGSPPNLDHSRNWFGRWVLAKRVEKFAVRAPSSQPASSQWMPRKLSGLAKEVRDEELLKRVAILANLTERRYRWLL